MGIWKTDYLLGEYWQNNEEDEEKLVPFPQDSLPETEIVLPNSVIGFSSVRLCSFQHKPISFLRSIGRLFGSDICLRLYIIGNTNWNHFVAYVWPLLRVSGIAKLCCPMGFALQNLRLRVSPTILCDCLNLQLISFGAGHSLEFPPNDSNESSANQALCKWLHSPRGDGQPKILVLESALHFPMDVLRTTFLNDTTSVPFIIRLFSVAPLDSFGTVNLFTRERLTSREDDGCWWMIERIPMDQNPEEWVKWERESMEDGAKDWKVLTMSFSC